MLIIPAIDLKEGRCVRLEQGLMEKDTVYSDDPAAQALVWQEQGGELLHIVDLDGAFAGVPKNKAAIRAIVEAIDIPSELGGGIRDLETIEAYLELGIDRVILGTVAKENPALVAEACRMFPGKIVVGIDARDGLVAVRGWADVTEKKAAEMAKEMEGFGVEAIIYTDIARDGMMQGPNIEATKALAEAISIPVIASGGLSSLDDIRRLMAIESSGVSGVITGKAIYSGAIDLREAVALTREK
ncbi:1-(5-phosphoribosyl)-5-[(5-phosphoribosylamino)methylideneamino]imidazole-4-carboxamide isomerase [Geothermobacter hydrogeniphilus]|uniref:1-(5-phosphoribosyl)-5-[(5-phosphoribosylamino)methylideneamino] imidazole-4-carboxamide isomerase n=1 Tax=Geothermobacter hydrogeniphilus TaxID=1969733 RepID=A0A1X0XQ58_9BACT|nr:1-(5-phosphoribosyl)-5-[(5-phosphoribosylamino)methylideneamino]imidazole-4-carboxamide isomerase [Geothermobacter hydrogeniphilus]ORJ55041.1 1-(5-phosphoribosyl)-5-[(5-phosphoribosylamino)methylideneamino]imidazole-4-carboxamide isomerase [Geothermobacter hydrogeniphilus]